MKGLIRGAIRVHLAGVTTPQTWEQVAAAIGMPGDVRVYQALYKMKRERMVALVAGGFLKLRDPVPRGKYATEAAKRAAQREADRDRKRKARAFVARPTVKPTMERLIKPKPEPGPWAKAARAESVEEWQAKGGRIERVPAAWERRTA